eukprot:g38078.t1
MIECSKLDEGSVFDFLQAGSSSHPDRLAELFPPYAAAPLTISCFLHFQQIQEQQLQEHTVIDEQTRNVVDEQPRNVVDGELGAGEELPGVDTFIVFEWVDYDGSNQYTGKYLPAWLHGQEEKQSINDPSTEDKEFKAWEKDVLASHIISLDICMQPSGESEGSSLQIASTDQEHI